MKNLGVVIKKALGNSLYDYGHLITLPFQDGWAPEKIAKLSQKKEKIPKLLQVINCN